jgi:protoporphyrinogen oxidase
MIQKTIAIVGGGISGLAIALRLSQSGYKTIVIEKQKIAGGLAASIPFKECMMDIGPHILLLPKSGQIHDEIIQKIGKKELQEIHWPWASSFTDKGFFDKSYPLFYDILFNFGIKYFVKGTLDIIQNKIKNNFKKSTFNNAEEYFIGTYGSFLYYAWFKPFFSETCQDLKLESVEFAKNIFCPISSKRILNFIQKRIKLRNNPYDPSKQFFNCYPKKGMGSFIEKIIEDIKNQNGQILLDTEIKLIQHSEDKKTITYLSRGIEHILNVDGIVYSTSLPVTLKWFDNIPNEITDEIGKMRAFNSIMTFLLFESPLLFDKWIITIYNKKSKIFRISQQNFLSEIISPKNTTLLCVEIKTNQDMLTNNDDEILEIILNEFKEMNILKNQKIIESKTIRFSNIYPMNTSHNANTEKIIEFITSFKNEYIINTVIDAGRLASTRQENDENKVDPKATGVYKALLNADILTKQIQNEIKQ